MTQAPQDELTGLRQLLHRSAIVDVLHRYCRAVDRLDPALLATCYHPDGTDDHGIFEGSAADYVTWVMAYVGQWHSTHHDISNPMIELDDDDHAVCESHWTGWYRLPAGAEGGDNEVVDLVSCGRYLDRFERRGGEWRIAHRVCVSDWSHAYPPSMPRPTQRLSGRRGPDDLVHQLRQLELGRAGHGGS